MDVIFIVVKFFADGGFFMYPILLDLRGRRRDLDRALRDAAR